MINRNALPVLLALALVPAGVQAATITVWEDWDFRGDSDVFDTTLSRLSDAGWNDRISSIRVESGSWEVCRDNDFRNCRTLGPGEEISRLESGWNDVVSSLRPVSAATVAVDPQTTAERLYRALLGRDADPEGLRNATAQVQAGRVTDLVSSLTQSGEFRTLRQNRPASELLDQIYRGLLGRPADSTARTAYLARVERGDVTEVVLDLLGSDEYAGAPTSSTAAAATDDTPMRGEEVAGTGVVIWDNQYYETTGAGRVRIGPGDKIRIKLNSTRPQQIDGRFTRESNDFLRIHTLEVQPRPPFPVEGGVQLENGAVGRVNLTSGAPGSPKRVAYSFVADGFELPREEAMCQDEIRAQLGNGVKVAFMAPERSRRANNRYQLDGEVAIISENRSAEYHCEVDASRNQVLNASVGR